MADNHSKEVRSINMSHIRSTNSKPEEIVRKYLFAEGFRYRKNVKKLPGCPDIVLPKYKTVIFVNGCFWHKHDCPRFVWPSSNQDYWRPKILRNIERDNQSRKELETLGWKVINASVSNFASAKRRFAEHGYKLPQIVFWNVASRNSNQPVTKNEQGVALVSGCTPRLFSMVASGDLSPYSVMMEIIESERYAKISA